MEKNYEENQSLASAMLNLMKNLYFSKISKQFHFSRVCKVMTKNSAKTIQDVRENNWQIERIITFVFNFIEDIQDNYKYVIIQMNLLI